MGLRVALSRWFFLMLLWPVAAVCEPAQLWSLVRWTGSVGGISAIEVTPDGQRFVALSDRSWLIEGRFERDQSGRIVDVIAAAPIPLRVGKSDIDSEGLVVMKDGSLMVSSENPHGLFRFRRDGTFIERHAMPDSGDWFVHNHGIEGLAWADGLIAMPERAGIPVPLWAERNGAWQQIARLDQRSGFAPVGADVGPDGALYILQRAVGLGFSSRILRVDLSTGVSTEIVAIPAGQLGNVEGLSVWTDAAGALMMTVVTDNNQNVFQRSDVVEFRLKGD